MKGAAGTLTAMVGASNTNDFARAEPLLQAFATTVVHVGGIGQGQLAKAFNNVLYNVSCAAMAEALACAERAGLDTEALARIVCAGSGHSFGFAKFAPLVLSRRFDAPANGYPMGSAFKDMEVVASVAREAGVELDVIAATRRTYEQALDMGLARECKGAMAKVWERRFGVTIGSHAKVLCSQVGGHVKVSR